MSTIGLIAIDLTLTFLCAVAWLGAATIKPRWVRLVALAAAALTLARVAVVVVLAGRGWWFVQEKVTFSLPLLGVAGSVAIAVLLWRGESAARVPLWAAGFTAMSVLLLPFFSGYPVSLDLAMVAVSLVGVATLTVWRMTSAVRVGRFLVPIAAVGLAGLALGVLPAQQVDAVQAHRHPAGRSDSAPDPGGEVRRYALEAKRGTITLASGNPVEVWTYNGNAPGPELTAVQGDLFEVTLTNVDIESGVTLHWHGYDVPNEADGAPGVTQEAVKPGGSYVYRFVARQAGTYWYHTHQVSSEAVRKGLFGMLIVKPRNDIAAGLDLTLPVHTFDGAVALGTNDGVLRRDAPAPGTPVRLRVANTDSTPHRVSLAGTVFRVTAADGDDLHGPGEVREVALRLAAGARYDLSFSMPEGGVALLVDDDPRRAALHLGDPAPASTGAWPELDLLSYGTRLVGGMSNSSRFDRDFTMVLDRGIAMVDGRPVYAQTVNGLGHPNIPLQRVREGDLVRFTVVNRALETHPWHLHGHRVLVLSKDGRAVTGSPLRLDTFDVRPGEVWQVAFRANNPGMWMNHCHNLDHADDGMALHLTYQN